MGLLDPQDDFDILCEQLGFPGSARLKAILEDLMTPEVSRMVVKLPGTPAEVAQALGLDEGEVSQALDGLFFKGVLFPKGDFNDRKIYRLARDAAQLHDATQATKNRDVDEDEDFYRLWHDFCLKEFYPMVGKYQTALPAPPVRIVPAYKALAKVSGYEPCEDFRELIKAQELIVVVPCACRSRTTAVGEHCEHTSEEDRWNCFQFGRAAEYALARDSGNQLSVDEALKLVDQIEEDGLLHIWPNSDAMTGVNTSCQCCRDCCMNYVPMDMVDESIGRFWAKARFEAVIDRDKCDGCQKCVERCHFDAITMLRHTSKGKKRPDKKLKAQVELGRCWGCGVCLPGCKEDAIDFITVRPLKHIPTMA